ncbi:uncharacterized protein LY89DRAFT_579748 [Mollisia scopiformis]|uniref:Uncharacterized protein n=1 Tax=Mollisia scopiformis TaxID=149040 RepID=A0A194XIZ4_MOLSC|nr:uncharacterized protein LY89DRAFT_579748 [Mollisia scopiformis]KUJ20215.1 hypothetical protein LY89DRAFT_579748 [Mollisia scopiformis]
MDDNSRRRRQNDPPYPGQDPRFGAEQGQGRGFSSSSSERYRPAPITTSPSTARGAGGATAYSGYYQGPSASFSAALPQTTLQYQPGYTQDQRQQSFATYNPDIMYDVAQQAPQNNVYDSTPQFQTRQPAGMQMLSDVAAPYFPNESTSAPGPPGLQHHTSSGSSNVYQQHQQSPADRGPLLQQGYSGNAMAMGAMPQPAPEIMEEDDYQAQGPGMEAAYTAYQTALKEIFQNIINGRLAEASQSLLEVSEWLLGHVGDLGLTVDEVALHSDRIRLWGEFNTAWLSIFQKQKDMLESGQRIQHPQTLMTQEYINKMAKDLIRMCDAVEKHGLVDYQYGVAEERIIMILSECLDLQESIEEVEGSSAANPGLGRVPP